MEIVLSYQKLLKNELSLEQIMNMEIPSLNALIRGKENRIKKERKELEERANMRGAYDPGEIQNLLENFNRN